MTQTTFGGQVGGARIQPQILPPGQNPLVDQLADALQGIERAGMRPVNAFASIKVTLAARPEASAGERLFEAANWPDPAELEDDLPRFFERATSSAVPKPAQKLSRRRLPSLLSRLQRSGIVTGLLGYLLLGFLLGLTVAMPVFWLASP
jgi:hypothetical protein